MDVAGSAEKRVKHTDRFTHPAESSARLPPDEQWMECVADCRYARTVTEARDLATSTEPEAPEFAWPNARLDEYRDLLEYLRKH